VVSAAVTRLGSVRFATTVEELTQDPFRMARRQRRLYAPVLVVTATFSDS